MGVNRKCSMSDALKAPREFMIFPAGEFTTDDGPHVMTREKADAIVALFNSRGNKMSIDFDHASIDTTAPPAARVAAGWINRLEARGDGEVWACDVEWTPEVQGWLTEEIPKFRYISPFYSCTLANGVAVPSEVKNVALTNNPKTWFCTRLASIAAISRGKAMDEKSLILAGGMLSAFGSAMGAPDATLATYAQEQDAALRAKLGEESDKALQMFSDSLEIDPASEPAPAVDMGEGDAAASESADKMDEKTVAASLAKAAKQIKKSQADKDAAAKLIDANIKSIPANVLPLLRKASLAEVSSFIADIARPAKPKPFVPSEREHAKAGTETIQRAASLVQAGRIRKEDAQKFAKYMAEAK